MLKLEKRAIICLLLAAVLLLGLGIFVYRYVTSGSDWVSYSGNSHIYNDSHLTSGTILDINDKVLAKNSVEGVTYNEDEAIRRATVHVVGDQKRNIGAGAESIFESELVGWNILNGVYSPTKSGHKVKLTIDADVCKNANSYLSDYGYNGMIAVYNYKTGDIKCLVSSPNFDPQYPPDMNDTDSSGMYLNKFFSATFVPGSIYKLITSTAAIENLDVDSFSYTCNGSHEVGGDVITCPNVHGTVDFEEALAYSCNGAFAELSKQLGGETLKKYNDKAGLSENMNINGIITPKGNFNFDTEGANLMWTGIGQYEDLVNPCSFLNYVGAIAGGGEAAQPKIIKSVELQWGMPAGVYTKKSTGKLLDEKTAKKLKHMMRRNVELNYGVGVFPDLNVCGKTGTAETGDGNSPHAWFTGFIDDEEHPYAFIVLVEHGASGVRVAAPIANLVLQDIVGRE